MIQIREMTRADVSRVAALEKECFADAWSEASIAAELDNPLSLWLVAVREELVIGYIGSQTVPDESDMMNVAVSPDARRMGVARALICALCESLRERGSRRLSLEVRVSNDAARELYRQLAFEQVGLRRGYYRNPKEDALILSKAL